MFSRRSSLNLSKLMVAVLLFSILSAVAVSRAHAQANKVKSLRVVHIGNSHSHSMYPIEYLAQSRGYEHILGKVNILGAPLWWIWDHPKQSSWPEVLAASNKWDIATLQGPRPDGEYAIKLMAEVYKGNPDCKVMMYPIWPGSYADWDNLPPDHGEIRHELVAGILKKAFPNKPKPRVIPSSLIIRELGRLADAGLLPGVPNRFAMTSDGGHLSKVGMYAIDMVVCAMLYGESPIKYPNKYGLREKDGSLSSEWYGSIDIPEKTASVIRQVAWDILLTYEPAGMATRLVITDRHIKPALAGRHYEVKLKSLNVKGSTSWSLVDGKLPKGLSLSSTGVISGKTGQTGLFAVTIKLADTKGSFERVLKLHVSEDRPVKIKAVTLKPVALDTHCFMELKSEGGVGAIKWDIAEGELPFGVELSSAGILVGTPGEAGKFDFTVRLRDSHPDKPGSVTQKLSWIIENPSPDTMKIKPVILGRKDKKFSLAKLAAPGDESYWKMKQEIKRKTGGRPQSTAAFNAFWVGSSKGKGSSLCVIVKVTQGPGGKTARDAVHIYLDARHNKEKMYNADDMHVVISRAGGTNFKRSLTPPWFMGSKVIETKDGYYVIANIGKAFFQGKGISVPFGPGAVYGFDIAVVEGEKSTSRLTWRGDSDIDEDTSSFGSIWLLDAPKQQKQRKQRKVK